MVFKKTFVEKFKDKVQTGGNPIGKEDLVTFIYPDGRCPFLDRTTRLCVIYEERPPICRKYGVEKGNLELACPFFKPNGSEWSEAMKKRIARIVSKSVNKLEEKSLHEDSA